MTFADTSALYAVLVSTDAAHDAARVAWDEHLSRRQRYTTSSYVIEETLALLQHRVGLAAVRVWRDAVEPILDVVWVDAGLHARALTALLAARRRDVSLTDWASFELMHASGIRRAFTLDRHYAEQGFDVVPEPGS
ncbi:MAG: type II toxin-antitoxin system VapC family toxin [Deltaproteobacteria bacterium]|nr:type II toxin-antitoxin system VapC family toxin [Deltaproteobacteria bacterium]